MACDNPVSPGTVPARRTPPAESPRYRAGPAHATAGVPPVPCRPGVRHGPGRRTAAVAVAYGQTTAKRAVPLATRAG